MGVVLLQEEEAQEPIRVEEGEQGAIVPTTHLTPVTQPPHPLPSPLARSPLCIRGANLQELPLGTIKLPLLLRGREATASMAKATARAKRTSASRQQEPQGDTLITARLTPARLLEEPEDRTTVTRVSIQSESCHVNCIGHKPCVYHAF